MNLKSLCPRSYCIIGAENVGEPTAKLKNRIEGMEELFPVQLGEATNIIGLAGDPPDEVNRMDTTIVKDVYMRIQLRKQVFIILCYYLNGSASLVCQRFYLQNDR